jgi:two-component system phosphate regulon sensor histidine kinase PhoR
MDFVAGISHELRNPLTAIQSAGFNLAQGTVHDRNKIQKYGEVISSESRRLTHMVEQVLSYAGLQSSVKQYDWQTVRLEEVLEAVLQEYAHVFQRQNWEIVVDIEEDLSSISGDPKALRSCLSNLIDNSLKYASEGTRLAIALNSRQVSGKNWVELSIQDQGQGIADSDLPNVFDPFYRGTRHVASSKSGSGLGLALVKRHVEAHGGKVNVNSVSGEGTCFVLFFPAAEGSPLLEKVEDDT